jgi:hypothetical protein
MRIFFLKNLQANCLLLKKKKYNITTTFNTMFIVEKKRSITSLQKPTIFLKGFFLYSCLSMSDKRELTQEIGT